MNKTKVIATIGPSSKDKETIKGLIESGMNVARINLKYADEKFCTEIVKRINEINEELKTNVAVLFDLKGPSINVGELKDGAAEYKKGSKIRIYTDSDTIGDETKFSINYYNLIEEVNYDSIIKVNDGKVIFQVIDKAKDYLLCEVLNGGTIYTDQVVNIPGIRLDMPFVTDYDKKCILLADKIGVDFIALSYVNDHEDILNVNDILIDLGNDHINIISKVENESALEDIEEIIRVSDGVMVARGDLGIEVELERVPGIQKNIISKCHIAGKISVVATELLSSMEDNPTPTRAEVSDIANAVLDGTDAVMLTGETTIGLYPVETVKTLVKILEESEKDIDYFDFMDRAIRTENKDVTGMLSYNVANTANNLKCKAIFAPTMSGYTAKKISRFRPCCNIIAASPNIDTIKSLQLSFGVCPILIGELKTFEKIIEASKKHSKDILELNDGDRIVITGGYPFKEVKHTNFMKIEEL